MKKRILALLLATIMVIGTLAGCSNSGEGKDTTVATTKGDEIIDPVVTDAPDTTAAPDTTVEVKDPVTSGKEDDPKLETKLNTEIISNLEFDYAGLVKKFGQPKVTDEYIGNSRKRFEGAYGDFWWFWPKHTPGFDITAEGKVDAIMNLDFEELFINAELPMTYKQVEEKFGVKYIYDYYFEPYTNPPQNNLVLFSYGNVTIVVGTQNSGVVDVNADCHVMYNEYPDSPLDNFWLYFYEVLAELRKKSENVSQAVEQLRKWSIVKKIDFAESDKPDHTMIVVTYGDGKTYSIEAKTDASVGK